nr:V/A-type H+/Na+-transporting ATPase subunit [Candidatus Cloacimonadota bacterium]
MSDQLQNLLTKVYEEGVAKANAEAEKILEQAKAEAEKLIADAKAKAEAELTEAKKKSEELKKNTEGDLKMAGKHTISALKQKITDLVLNATIDDSVKNGFDDVEYFKSLIKETLESWKEANAGITISDKLKDKIDDAFVSSLKKCFDGKLEIDFSPQIKAGFTISPLDGSYKLSFTDEDFAQLFKNYLRPRTAKILFKD